jgi:hypothetical protein
MRPACALVVCERLVPRAIYLPDYLRSDRSGHRHRHGRNRSHHSSPPPAATITGLTEDIA